MLPKLINYMIISKFVSIWNLQKNAIFAVNGKNYGRTDIECP